MAQIRTILVPVDFSVHSSRALEHAIEFAKAFRAEVVLMHCYPINTAGISPYGLVLSGDFDRQCREAAGLKLAEWRDKASAEGVEVSEVLTPRLPSEAIAETARERGANLIVMGTRGLTGLAHVVLGSIAERTIRTAPCPVLTVKEAAEDLE